MIDKHIQKRILRIMGEMQQDIASATSLKKMRSMEDYLSFFREFEGVLRQCFSQERQRVYGKLLHPLLASLERLARKRGTDRKKLSSCKQMIRELAEELAREKEVKKAIVFLPYNASMWDSMESVWRAAREDSEHCNAYVIPIPYCDKNPDGSPKEWHCDVHKFPKEVPVLNWETTDLRELHPEVIIVHDPYEETNLVTAVDSRYYSRELKQCTDKLVYIPYFVFPEPDLKNKGFMDYIGRFAKQPGVIRADLTIVQSEAVREAYIRALEQLKGPYDRSYWEKRILAMGSPKIDKIRNLKREDYTLPKDWKAIIGNRKVILYNTSVTDVTNRPEQFLVKLRDVIDTFRENKGVVLWWRPHPLLESTIRSLCPQILDRFLELREAYRKEGLGIYDDTSDMHRSIAYSDAFYGDGSSMAILYRMTGKSVLVQNYNILNRAPAPQKK